MSEHTPGPWAIGRQPTSVADADGFEIASTFGLHLHNDFDADTQHWADVAVSRRDVPEEEEEANAEFIMRACNSHEDLLEACKELLAWVADHPDPHDPSLAAKFGRAADAIAKAEAQP